jgi:hypothetical protein
VISAWRAITVPSRSAPVFSRITAGCRDRWISMSCVRDSASFTGLPVARASHAVIEWMLLACFPPKPPPTRETWARICDIGTPSSSATRVWIWWTDWQVASTVMRPLPSTSARTPLGSM